MVKMKVKFKLSMYLIYFLCFIQVSAIEKSKKFNQPQTKGGLEEVSAGKLLSNSVTALFSLIIADEKTALIEENASKANTHLH